MYLVDGELEGAAKLVVTDSLQRHHSVCVCGSAIQSPLPRTVRVLPGVQTKSSPEQERNFYLLQTSHQDISINEVMATSSGLAGTLTETAVSREENTTLKLKLTKKKQTKKIQWTEDTVDNEGIETY